MNTEIDQIQEREDQFLVIKNVLECSIQNIYGCFENIVLEVVALISVFLGLIALRKIMKDRNQILDWWDKVIVSTAFGQFIILSFFFGFIGSSFLQYSIRAISFVICILSCYIIISIHELSDEMKQNFTNIFRFSLAYVFSLWFFCGFFPDYTDKTQYNCTHIDWILISGSTFIFGSLQAYVTSSIIQSILNHTNTDISFPDEGIQNYSKDDGENRKSQLTILMIGIFMPSLIQLVWDCIAFSHSQDQLECNDFFYASNFLSFLMFTVLKLICFFQGPISIFIVFYWKNRNYINTHQDNPNGQVFFDRRSDLIDKYSF